MNKLPQPKGSYQRWPVSVGVLARARQVARQKARQADAGRRRRKARRGDK
jgi:hypothetical protein